MTDRKEYYAQMTKEVEEAASKMNEAELIENIVSCKGLLTLSSIEDEDKEQIKKELAIYEKYLNQ
jgi:hypothetical protein